MDINSTNTLKRSSSVPKINSLIGNSKPNLDVNIQGQPAVPASIVTNRIIGGDMIDNVFSVRARRYSASASFTPMSVGSNNNVGPRLTPRVSQLRQEECADISNSREMNHEREIHAAIQMSQSCEDLSLDAESWSITKNNDHTDIHNSLHIHLPTGHINCSSPSPTRLRLPYALSPSPTRRAFATRRSMSPVMRASSLGPVKRKFELDDVTYSPPPFKKAYAERDLSPLTCSSPSEEGRTTPKLSVSKLCNYSRSSSNLSLSSSPSSIAPSNQDVPMDPTIETDKNQPIESMVNNVKTDESIPLPRIDETECDGENNVSENGSLFLDSPKIK